MPAIMPDHNVEGQFQILLSIWTSPDWSDLWESAACESSSFERLGVPSDLSDLELWKRCQAYGIVLLTGNRSADSSDSLETVIRTQSGPTSLPVLTIADPDLVMTDKGYALRVAVQVLDYLLDLDRVRGTGRLYVP